MVRRVSTFLVALLLLPSDRLYSQIAPPAMIGRWHGVADVIGAWPKQRTLDVDVIITPDDSVHGMVGDAMLVQGRLLADRQNLVVSPRWNTEFVAVGMLSGPVVRAGNIWRTGVQLMLSLNGELLEGGLSTTGV
ncbi:MAG: hypothetical protein ACHQWU_14355, partial [Gemmatimonadales bacterium]